MSTSFIHIHNLGFWLHDTVLVDVAELLLKTNEKFNRDSDWLMAYNEVLKYMIEVQPVGWATMELDKYITDDTRKLQFLLLIDTALVQLKEEKYDVNTDHQLLEEYLIKIRKTVLGEGMSPSD